MVLVMLGHLNSGQERMDSSWAGIEEGKAGRSVCCVMCDAEWGHVLWDCPAYASIRSAFMLELRRELGDQSLGSHLMS